MGFYVRISARMGWLEAEIREVVEQGWRHFQGDAGRLLRVLGRKIPRAEAEERHRKEAGGLGGGVDFPFSLLPPSVDNSL